MQDYIKPRMSLGCLSQLYSNLASFHQSQICSVFKIHPKVFATWMHVITYLRNTCAHHGRLWNRGMAIRPLIPDKDEQWKNIGLNNEHLFASVVMAEWICDKAQLTECNIELVYEIMRRISGLDARFSAMMGIPIGRTIGMCWGSQK